MTEQAAIDRRWVWLGAAVAAVAWVAHDVVYGTGVLPVDDAYITLRNAQSLWEADPVWTDSSPLRGATSGWHTLSIAAALAVFSPTTASHVVGGLALVAYVAGLVQLAANLQVDRGLVLPLALVGALVGDLPHHLFNGLETGFALAALTWTLALWTGERSTTRDVALGLLCGQLPWVRPELGFVGASVIGFELLDREDRRDAAPRILGLAALGALPWLVAYTWATGRPLASTASVKAAWFTEYCLPLATRLKRAGNLLLEFGGTVGVVAIGWVFMLRERAGWVGLAFLTVFVAGFVWLMPGGLGHYTFRYLYIGVPFAVVGLASGAAWLGRVPGAVALVVLYLQLAFTVPAALDHHKGARGFTTRELVPMGNLLQRLPDDAVILVHDAGYLGFAGNRRLIDLVGLKTPSSARTHAEVTGPSCGERRGEAIAAIAAQAMPTHGVFLRRWDERYEIGAALRKAGWRTTALSPPERKYVLVALSPPARAPSRATPGGHP